MFCPFNGLVLNVSARSFAPLKRNFWYLPPANTSTTRKQVGMSRSWNYDVYRGIRRAADENLPKYKHDAQASEHVRSLWTHLLALRAGIIFFAARLRR